MSYRPWPVWAKNPRMSSLKGNFHHSLNPPACSCVSIFFVSQNREKPGIEYGRREHRETDIFNCRAIVDMNRPSRICKCDPTATRFDIIICVWACVIYDLPVDIVEQDNRAKHGQR